MLTSLRGHTKAAELLINYGANINNQNNFGTALHAASRNGHESIVELLLKHKADRSIKDKVRRR